MARSFTDRMIGAATLDVATYEEVEHDESATGQAVAVVALVAAAQAAAAFGAGPIMMARAAGSQLIGFGLWCVITFFIGTRLFNGTATVGEIFRAVGFAQSPGLLILIALIPILGGFVGALISPFLAIWVLIAVVIGVRQSLDVSTGQAVIASVLGGLAYLILVAIIPGL